MSDIESHDTRDNINSARQCVQSLDRTTPPRDTVTVICKWDRTTRRRSCCCRSSAPR